MNIKITLRGIHPCCLTTWLQHPAKFRRNILNRGVALVALALIGNLGAFTRSAHAEAHSPVLDKQQQLDRFTFWDNRDWDWYKNNIPFFESPDKDIDTTYYYRWEVVTKHMTYGSPNSGYCFKEFITNVPWAGAYGAISCPVGLQIYELRWLKDRRVTDDYIRYWFHTPGAQPRSYSNWYGDAVWANYLVNGDKDFVIAQLPSMEAQYAGWMGEHWDKDHQMFHWSGMHDGMESNIESRQTQNGFSGADSYRPTLNSYVYGDLMAITATATLAGDDAKAAQYRDKAKDLKKQIQSQLWDAKRNFFYSQFHDDEVSPDGKNTVKAGTLVYQDGKFAGDSHGRELSGYCPWMFNLPDPNRDYESAWKGVSDPDVFLATFGLSFTERHDPQFLITGGGCVWSGNNWPYADSEVLMAMANVINNYPQKVISKDDYFKVFQAYTHCHQKDGQPYIAEDGNPDTGAWLDDTFNHSEHYFHSSYVDLLISGLVGLRPRQDNIVEVNPLVPDQWNYFALDDVSYHGHRILIVWDRDGSRYRCGLGLTVIADGQVIGNRATLGDLQAKLPVGGPAPAPADHLINFAVNNDGTSFPKIVASFTGRGTSISNAVDGTFFYHAGRPVNRWTTEGSPNLTESVAIDFGMKRPLKTVKLYLLDDGEGQAVRAPASFALEFWDGAEWKRVPGQTRIPEEPLGHCPNVINFPELMTPQIRAVFTPQPNSAIGLTEFEAWGNGELPLAPVPLPPGDLALEATASASFTCGSDRVSDINDGIVPGVNSPRNRWTSFLSPNPTDWIQLDFAQQVEIGRLEICWYSDGGGVRLPKKYKIQYWSGTDWTDVQEVIHDPSSPTKGVDDMVTITPVVTEKLRLTFENNLPGKTGVTELIVRGK